MTIGTVSIGEDPVAGQAAGSSSTKRPPKSRQMVARADAVSQPEPR